MPAPSLTLRDYSKVVAGSNLRMRQKPPPMRTVGGAMPSLRFRCSAVCLTVLLTLIPSMLSAQGTGGRIIGRVADRSGAVLTNVKVTLVNEATNVSRDAVPNSGGDYDFIEVPVGTYRLEFDLTVFKKNIRRGVALHINQVIPLNMTMQVGATQEAVDVT